MWSWKRSMAAFVAFVFGVAGTVAAVQAYRRRTAQRDVHTGEAPGVERVLADRIRSELGQLEHQLDVPRVHVTVERHVAMLHGDVPSAAAARAIEARVRGVPGVLGVDSHLHVGLLPGDTRPSAGAVEPSAAARRLVDAARRGGAGEVTSDLATRAVLGTFMSLLPSQTRRHITAHLPADAAALLALPVGVRAARHVRTVDDLYAAVVAMDVIPASHAPWVVDHVLGALRSLVPDEDAGVAAALPQELRHLWGDTAVGRDAG